MVIVDGEWDVCVSRLMSDTAEIPSTHVSAVCVVCAQRHCCDAR